MMRVVLALSAAAAIHVGLAVPFVYSAQGKKEAASIHQAKKIHVPNRTPARMALPNADKSGPQPFKLPLENAPPDAGPYPYGPQVFSYCQNQQGHTFDSSQKARYAECLDVPGRTAPTTPNYRQEGVSRGVVVSW